MAAMAMMTGAFAGCNKDDNNNGAANGGGNVPDGWVDLALPSGLLWAECNVGATVPEEYGDYFAWGEIQPKSVYDWNTYAYGSTYNQLTKYCSNSNFGLNGFTDNLTILEPSNDVATVLLGNGARIPTKDEWDELLNNTTVEWTTVDVMFGCKCTGSNGNTIFLPAAGCRNGSEINEFGRCGNYWSATLYLTYPSEAWYFLIYGGFQYSDYCSRFYGQSVRAVRAR